MTLFHATSFQAFTKKIHQKWKTVAFVDIFMPHLLRGSSSPVVSNHWEYIAASYFPNSYSHPYIGHRLTSKIFPEPSLALFFNFYKQDVMLDEYCGCWKGQFFRHDCQDGSDENDCDYSHLAVNKNFFCFK